MEIRPLAKEDLPALLALYGHLHRSDDPLPPQSEIEVLWSEIQSDERLCYFGGFLDGELVSTCSLAIIPNLTRGCRPYGLIENVVTHASHRKQGYGTALLRSALSHAWEAGCYKVMLLTGSKNENTLRFYEGAGFIRGDKTGFVARRPDTQAH